MTIILRPILPIRSARGVIRITAIISTFYKLSHVDSQLSLPLYFYVLFERT